MWNKLEHVNKLSNKSNKKDVYQEVEAQKNKLKPSNILLS